MKRSAGKKERHGRIVKNLEANPLLTDEEIAGKLGVSVSTIRLDRALLGIPEVRERMRSMASQAGSRLRSLKRDEIIGELLELQPDEWALSTIQTTGDMAFRHTGFVSDHYIYSMASCLAVAVIEADMAVTGSARVRYRHPAKVGERLVARAKVGTKKGNKYVVSVRIKVGEREIFLGRFITVVGECDKASFENKEESDTGASGS
ncbi:MAG TPA: transcription factor FapR [Synergistales bacterium]|jgi:acyl-coenzyme A thioesterase PaaI-like protein|nr:transcription factor FapR [Synergistales bacterium]HRV70605.1 transcription factor FapR [Thermovirgaceae bacterium]